MPHLHLTYLFLFILWRELRYLVINKKNYRKFGIQTFHFLNKLALMLLLMQPWGVWTSSIASKSDFDGVKRKLIFGLINSYNLTSYWTQFTKPNVPNQIHAMGTKINLLDQMYQSKSTKPNLPSIMFEIQRSKYAKPNLFNQIYKTKSSNQFYRTKSRETKTTEN